MCRGVEIVSQAMGGGTCKKSGKFISGIISIYRSQDYFSDMLSHFFFDIVFMRLPNINAYIQAYIAIYDT